MDSDIQENAVETQENVPEEEKGGNSGKKKGIIIGAATLVVVAVVLIWLLGVSGNGKIEIGGKACEYSAEYGIKGVEQVCDGVVVSGTGKSMFYPISGEPEEVNTMDVLDGKYPVAYFGTMRIGDNDLALTSYNVFGEFKTQFGATHKSTKAELEKKDFVLSGDVYSVICTDKGAIGWADIEKDYEKIVSSNSFDSIEYIDSACLVGPDVVKMGVMANDVQSVVNVYDSLNTSTAKDNIMRWLAMGKAVHMLLEGEVKYVVEEGVYYKEGESNTLYIRMYTSLKNSEKIKENMR